MFNGLIISNKAKTLLRYPGGKSRAIKIICRFIPKNIKNLCSPFFGGGAIELTCAQQGIKVFAYDIFEPLVNFWQCVFLDRGRVADLSEKYYPVSKEVFYKLQKNYDSYESNFEKAAIFYYLNCNSFSGTTFSGGMPINNNDRKKNPIKTLRNFDTVGVEIKCLDFTESIPLHKDCFLYLDPPYIIKDALYGYRGNTHRGFRHNLLALMLKERNGWVLSYNNCPEVAELYKGYRVLYPKWTYTMSNDKMSKEVLIFSNDIDIF